MKRFQKLLITAVILLIFINIALLGFIWKGHRLNQPYRGPMLEQRMDQQITSLGDRLQLEDEQKQALLEAFRDHHQEMRSLDRKEILLRRRVHEAAFQNNQQALDSLKSRARLLASQRIETYTIFSRNLSRNINPDQREEFIRMLTHPFRNAREINQPRNRINK
ncbi:MAG: hypothetical protein ACO2ZZ_06350 [Cyclobacteriaceae bacterium]